MHCEQQIIGGSLALTHTNCTGHTGLLVCGYCFHVIHSLLKTLTLHRQHSHSATPALIQNDWKLVTEVAVVALGVNAPVSICLASIMTVAPELLTLNSLRRFSFSSQSREGVVERQKGGVPPTGQGEPLP